jgi:pimeloyl-ACP methyl ester carboxylesterase
MINHVGSGAGLPVVLIHGNFASSRWWGELLAEPMAGVRLIAVDLPGFFGSPAPADHRPSIYTFADAVIELSDALELDAPVIVGHSLGGAVAMEVALKRPARVRALALIDSCPPDGLKTPEAYYPILESYRTSRPALAQALRAIMPARQPRYFDELVDDAAAMHPAAFSGNARALENWNAAGRTRAYPGPVLVISGVLDPLITAEMAARTAAAFALAREVRLEGVGHSPQIEAPARFRAELARFLEEVTS